MSREDDPDSPRVIDATPQRWPAGAEMSARNGKRPIAWSPFSEASWAAK